MKRYVKSSTNIDDLEYQNPELYDSLDEFCHDICSDSVNNVVNGLIELHPHTSIGQEFSFEKYGYTAEDPYDVYFEFQAPVLRKRTMTLL